MFRKIMLARVKTGHSVFRVLMFTTLALFMQYFVVPIVIWMSLGYPQHPDGLDYICDIIWLLATPILLLPIVYIRMKYNFKKNNYPRAKSYIYAASSIIIFSGIILMIFLMSKIIS